MKKILLVDDDPVSNFVSSCTIEHMEMADEIITCESGEDGLMILLNAESEDELPDLILLDINMPTMNGWEFLEEYRVLKTSGRIGADIPVVILTSSVFFQDKKKSEEFPEITGYLMKPLKLEDLEEIRVKTDALILNK